MSSNSPPEGAFIVGRRIDAEREACFQKQWTLNHPFRRETGLDDDAPVLVVRGNHDFIDLADWIGGDVWEATSDPTRTTKILGLKVGGVRGIRKIIGEWSDELDKEAFDDRTRNLPEDIDVLITHSPPHGILDKDSMAGNRWGSESLTNYVTKRGYLRTPVELKAHLFGHVHGAFGQETLDSTRFSNAATGVQMVEL